MRSGKFFTFVTFLTLAVGTAAQQGGSVRLVPPSSAPIRFAENWKPPGSVTTMVVGTVVDADRSPVAKSHVQLRDILSGKVLLETDADALGKFEFKDLQPGSYIVEMVLPGQQQVVALSNATTIARYETFDALLQLPGRWDYGTQSVVRAVKPTQFFGLGSNNSMTASTLSMAAGYQVRPVDAGEPVSPR